MCSSALLVHPEDVGRDSASGAMFHHAPRAPLAAPVQEITLSLERLLPGANGTTVVARLPFRHSERIERLRLRLAALRGAVNVNNALVRVRRCGARHARSPAALLLSPARRAGAGRACAAQHGRAVAAGQAQRGRWGRWRVQLRQAHLHQVLALFLRARH